MSQQLQITGGAKVRSLEGVITGSTGVLGSLPINGSNGIPQLDVNGKILVSQLPNSVMEYLGTWDAATNTPTLANGTGNAGDVYLCNVAGTVNFGAGPITFYVGDQVIYSGSIWQRASGATGSVTSVAVTESGDALTITGSPITTSGTINIGFAGTSAQYVAGDGTLVTFPTITTEAQRLITEVYNETGATLTKGTVVYINGGHGNLPTIAKALATSDATSAQTYGVVQSDIGNNNNGFVVVIGSLTDLDTQAYANGTQLYLSPTTAGAWTSTKQYAPAHLVYVGIVTRSHPTQGVVEIKIQNGYELDELHNVSAQTPSNNDGLFYNSSTSLWENKSIATALGYTPLSGSGTTNYLPKFTGSTALGNSLIYDNGTNVGIGTASPTAKLSVAGTTAISGQLTLGDTITNGTYTYTLPGATGTLALTSDIPSVTNFVTLNTLQTIIGTKIYTSLQYYNNGVYLQEGTSGSSTGYTSLAGNTNGIKINLGTGTSNNNLNFASTTTGNTYTFPNATGTIALTTDLTSYVPTSRTLTINGTTYDLSADRSWTVSGSQWTTSGSDIYYNTGNVGINQSSPTYKLDVGGTIRATGTILAGATNGNIRLSGTTDAFIGVNTSTMYLTDWATAAIGMTINLTTGVTTNTGNLTANGVTIGSSDIRSSSNVLTIGGTSEVMRITGGNVGIGNTGPSYKLDVTGTARISSTVTIASAPTTYGIFNVKSNGSTPYYGVNIYANGNSNFTYINHDNNLGVIGTEFGSGGTGHTPLTFQVGGSERMRITTGGFVGVNCTPNAQFEVFGTSGNALTDGIRVSRNTLQNSQYGVINYSSGILNITGVETSSGGEIRFNTSNGTTTTERVRIGNQGNVGIGVINDADIRLFAKGQNSTSSQFAMLIQNSNANNLFFVRNDGYINVGQISASPYNNTYGNAANAYLSSDGSFGRSTSSLKYKKNVENYTKGLNEVMQLRPVSYQSKNTKENGLTFAGLIAEEVHELGLTEFVQYAEDGTPDALSYQNMVSLLVKAIQELKLEIDELKNK